MPQSRTRAVGLDGHQEPIAVAYVAQAHEAEGGSRGSIGTRQCDIDTLSRRLQATRPAPRFGLCSRALRVLALARSHEHRRGLLGGGPLTAPTEGR
jgi:hypothetical protein